MSTSVCTVFVRNVCIERRDVHGHKEGVRGYDIGAVDIVYMSKEVHVVLYVRVESSCKWSEMVVNKNRYFFSGAAVAADYRSAGVIRFMDFWNCVETGSRGMFFNELLGDFVVYFVILNCF